jgi:hypothetical protein
MSDPSYVTAFEDHAKRASASLPDAVVERLPFDAGERLGVRESGGRDGIAVVADPHHRDPDAILRRTDRGVRLYLDRMTAYEADLLESEVELTPHQSELHIRPVE